MEKDRYFLPQYPMVGREVLHCRELSHTHTKIIVLSSSGKKVRLNWGPGLVLSSSGTVCPVSRVVELLS